MGNDSVLQSEQEQVGYLLAEEHGGRPKACAHDKPTCCRCKIASTKKEGYQQHDHTNTYTPINKGRVIHKYPPLMYISL